MQNNTQTQTRDARETLNAGKERLSEYAASTIEQGEEKIRKIVSTVQKEIKEGEAHLKEAVSLVDQKLHENPWPIVTGVALGCLFMGFLMGMSKRKD